MYQKLFTPCKIGGIEVKNRVVMSPMESGLNSYNGEASDRIIDYYERRAEGGCGLIITEITRVMDGHGSGHPRQLNATSVGMVGGLEKLADSVHRHGAKIFCQLHHPGREAKSMFCGEQIVGPSPIASFVNEEEPRELTTEEVGAIVQQFVMAAKFCQIAGIDGVELHGAHEYLIHQFMCEHSNQRDDKYGGSFEKRMQFVTEIVMMIKMVCGEDFPVCVRINGSDFNEGGMDLEYAIKIAKHLEMIGVDAINVSAGGYANPNVSTEPMSYEQGWKRHLSKAIKEAVDIPVMACGVIRQPQYADEVLVEDNIDFVVLGRPHLADPDWANKAKAGDLLAIRPCISCMHCAEELGAAKCIKCAVNPKTSYEATYKYIPKDGEDRLAVVVGGGPAGMQAAITLRERGFKVSLYESKAWLGGDLQLATIPPHKDKIQWLIDHMIYMMDKLGVDVHLSTAITPEQLKELNPYVGVVAIGGDPIMPAFKGIELPHVYSTDDILVKEFHEEGKKVVVVGSGMTGLEVAEYLAQMNNDVLVIEKEYELAPGAAGGIGSSVSPTVADTLKHLEELGVKTQISTELMEIAESKIFVDGGVEDKEIPCDMVVLSLGVRTDSSVIDSFKDAIDNVLVVGDANKPGRVSNAIRSAFEQTYFLK